VRERLITAEQPYGIKTRGPRGTQDVGDITAIMATAIFYLFPRPSAVRWWRRVSLL